MTRNFNVISAVGTQRENKFLERVGIVRCDCSGSIVGPIGL
jgi:hypothetical protein